MKGQGQVFLLERYLLAVPLKVDGRSRPRGLEAEEKPENQDCEVRTKVADRMDL